MTEKETLLARGHDAARAWLAANGVDAPRFVFDAPARRRGGPCGHYRPYPARAGAEGVVTVYVARCARAGRGGREWSWPGYPVDRTPHGVVLHELGHHVDTGRGGRRLSHDVHRLAGEDAITAYAPSREEWFAEMVKLFISNPDLLRAIRPRTFQSLEYLFPSHVETRPWREVLADSPRRVRAAENRVADYARRSRPLPSRS